MRAGQAGAAGAPCRPRDRASRGGRRKNLANGGPDASRAEHQAGISSTARIHASSPRETKRAPAMSLGATRRTVGSPLSPGGFLRSAAKPARLSGGFDDRSADERVAGRQEPIWGPGRSQVQFLSPRLTARSPQGDSGGGSGTQEVLCSPSRFAGRPGRQRQVVTIAGQSTGPPTDRPRTAPLAPTPHSAGSRP